MHKLIISTRRKTEEKLLKERQEALAVLTALIKKGEFGIIKTMFAKMPANWRKKVVKILKDTDNKSILTILEQKDIT